MQCSIISTTFITLHYLTLPYNTTLPYITLYYSSTCIIILFLALIVHRYSLGRSNKAIAALLCALYPKFPNSSTDNRYMYITISRLIIVSMKSH